MKAERILAEHTELHDAELRAKTLKEVGEWLDIHIWRIAPRSTPSKLKGLIINLKQGKLEE
jgi:hypothetical protein